MWFLQDVLDTLFVILDDNTEKYGLLVFSHCDSLIPVSLWNNAANTKPTYAGMLPGCVTVTMGQGTPSAGGPSYQWGYI
ncbi:dedicator of cytokinesis protein 4-like [Callithrix jacchus]